MLIATGCSLLSLVAAPAASAQSLVAAVLPSSRSVQVGSAATAFASIINTGSATATSCSIAAPPGIAATFSYQTTNPATNQVTGSANTPVDIPAGATQTFVFGFTPTAPISPTEVALVFDCTNTTPADSVVGLNTLLLSASSTPIPDIVALAATLNNDGISSIRGTSGAGVLSVATVNVGAAGTITASMDFGSVSLPANLSICQTNPSTGACLTALAPTVTTTIGANETPTFGVFLSGAGQQIPFNPAANRLFIRFRDAGGTVRGATSVALRSVTDLLGNYSGSGTVSQSGCLNPANNGSFTAAFSVNMTNQVGEAFSGTASESFTVPGQGSTVTNSAFNGTLDAAERLRGSFTFATVSGGVQTAAGSGTFTGAISGNLLTVQVSGLSTAGETCTILGSTAVAR